VRRLTTENRNVTPHAAFEKDFKAALVEWLDNGDELVVSINANQDARKGHAQRMFKSLGLLNTILLRHPNLSMLATHARNKIPSQLMPFSPPSRTQTCNVGICLSRKPSQGTTVLCGWTSLRKWSPQPPLPHLFKSASIGFTTNDPCIQKAYHKKVLTGCRKHDVVNKAASLRQMVANNAPLESIAQAHEELYKLNLTICKAAELGIHKKQMGKVK
jgi:hypothetical protein